MREVRRAVRPGGHAIVATFATDGPARCSGLDTVRYDTAALSETLGPGFEAVEHRHETHRTPGGGEQRFLYGLYRIV